MTESKQLPNSDDQQPSVSYLQMAGSILASFFGVQNSERRKRDFTFGKAKAFFTVGVIMAVIWYAIIYVVVQVVLK